MFLSQKSEHLMSLARILDRRLGPEGYDGILREAGAENAPREEKIAVLNRALREATEETASVSEGLGVGYYSFDLDASLTYGPFARFGNLVGVTIPPDHPGRRVMATNTPAVELGTMVRGDIMNAMLPVVRQGRVIGYIWANELLSDIEITLNRSSKVIFVLLALAYGLMAFIIVAFFRKLTRAERESLAAARSAAEETKRLGEMMYIVNKAVVSLMAADEKTFEEALQTCMQMMASAFGLDRIFIWKTDEREGRGRFRAVAVWFSDVGKQYQPLALGAGNFTLESLPDWRERLSRNENVKILHSRLSNADRLNIASSGILSLICIPVFLEEAFWGFVGFAGCRQEREFTQGEEDILLSGSLLMANAVRRRETMQILVKAHAGALAATKAKSAFLAKVSHELRTPLNAIIGLSEVELRENLSERTQGNLEKILNSGANLLAIVNDILDISRIEAGGFEITPKAFDIPTLINDVVQLNIVRISSKPVSFTLDISETMPAVLIGDELRVKQVMNNLLSNAFKYTNEGRVVFRVRSRCEGDDAVVRITVMDTGVGIKKEETGKLFEEYRRMQSLSDRSVEGTGLGLSIVKHLTELMGGTIRVRSRYGRGSVFSVTLRLKSAGTTPIGRETADNLRRLHFMENRMRGRRNLVRSLMPQGRVLVVDDLMMNLDVARGLMLPYGLTIDCVSSGREAIERIRAVPEDAPASGKYDIVFMDHMMPEMDGVEATRIIREEIDTEYARTVPVVALTANAVSGTRDMFLRNGFNGFISKPIDIHQLDAILNQWVHRKENAKDPDGTRTPDGATASGGAKIPDGTRAVERCGSLPDEVVVTPDDFRAVTPVDVRIDGIDIKAGIARYDSEERYFGIIRSYVRHTPELFEKLSAGERAHPAKEGMKEYATAVHGLKGSSYAVCADFVGRQAEALERAAKAEEWETVRMGHPALMDATTALLAKLEEFLKNIPARDVGKGKEKPRRAAPDEEILKKMLAAARCFNTVEVDNLLAELENFAYEAGADNIAWLREQVDYCEYESLAKRLEEMLADNRA
jgi:signal transduction histidine kinase/CheY-like chemotaxis protein